MVDILYIPESDNRLLYKSLVHGKVYIHCMQAIGLDKLCFLFCLLFLLTILKKSAYYSSLVYPLFQFKDVTFILEKTICLWLLLCITESEIYSSIVLSFAFEKKLFPKEKIL